MIPGRAICGGKSAAPSAKSVSLVIIEPVRAGACQTRLMFEFLRAGGPFMILLVLTSIVGLTFIVERGLALRWRKVVPPEVEVAVENCFAAEDVKSLRR